MKKFVIKITSIVAGEQRIGYHEKISNTPKNRKAMNVYRQHITSDINKAKVFYDIREAMAVGNLFVNNVDISFSIITKDDWICIDNYTKQFGRKLSDTSFEFKEDRDGETYQSVIDLKDYTDEEIEDVITTYGYTLKETKIRNCKNIHKLYSADANWIMAECIFEQEN